MSLMNIPLSFNYSHLHRQSVWETTSRSWVEWERCSTLSWRVCLLSYTSAVRQYVMNYPLLTLSSSHDLHAMVSQLRLLHNLISLNWSSRSWAAQMSTCRQDMIELSCDWWFHSNTQMRNIMSLYPCRFYINILYYHTMFLAVVSSALHP